jgi:hypothetical protein
VRNQARNEFDSVSFTTQFNAGAWGFYDYFLEVCGMADTIAKIIPLRDLALESNWVYPYQKIAIMSEKPTEIHMINGRTHNEFGPAVLYADGFSVYALNGIRVPEWAIETPKDQIDPKRVLALENTEQRMVLMKHLGLAKFLNDLNAEMIHQSNGYRLYYLTVENNKIGPYLYMKCPSSGREFLEGCGDPEKYEFLDPTIKTCEDALIWRARKASGGLMTEFTPTEKWEYHS